MDIIEFVIVIMLFLYGTIGFILDLSLIYGGNKNDR